MSGRFVGCLCAALFMFACLCRQAQADELDGPSSTNQRAVALGHEALKLYAAQKWSDSQTLFEAAEAIAHSPVFGLYIARCERQRGHLLRAREQLQQVIDAALPNGVPNTWHRAVDSAKLELHTLQPLIPSVRLLFPELASVRASLWVDGALQTAADAVIELDPGIHFFTLNMQGQTYYLHAQLQAGEKERLLTSFWFFTRDPLPTSVVRVETVPSTGVAPPLPQPLATPVQIKSEQAALPPAGIVAAGVGAGAIIVGSVMGLLAFQMHNTLRDHCDSELICDAEGLQAARLGHQYALTSTISFAVGIAGLGVSAAIIVPHLTNPSGKSNLGGLSVSGAF